MESDGSLKNVIATPALPSEDTLSKYQYSHAVALIAESLGTSNGFSGEVLMETGPVTVWYAVTALVVQLGGGGGQATVTGRKHAARERINLNMMNTRRWDELQED